MRRIVSISIIFFVLLVLTLWQASSPTFSTALASPLQATVTLQTTDTAPTICTQVLGQATTALTGVCNKVDKDQICYTSNPITADFVAANAAQTPTFAQAGDTIAIDALKTINLGVLDPNSGSWGAAILKPQVATKTNYSTDQTANLLLFGGAAITNITFSTTPLLPAASAPTAAPVYACGANAAFLTKVRAGPSTTTNAITQVDQGKHVNVIGKNKDGKWAYVEYQGQNGWMFSANLDFNCTTSTLPIFDPSQPLPVQTEILQLPALQTFTLSTAATDQAQCTNLPPSALYVESPKDKTITIKVNGVDVTIGARALITAVANKALTVLNISGTVTMNAGGTLIQLPTGYAASVTLGGTDGLQAAGTPSAAQPFPNLTTFTQTTFQGICSLATAAGSTAPCSINVAAPTATPAIGHPAGVNQPGS